MAFAVVVAIGMLFIPDKDVGEVVKQRITLQVSKEMSLYGDFYPENSKKAIILIHMYKQDRTSWDFLIPELRKEGYNILTIDLRGHGESTDVVKEPTENDFKSMASDLSTAIDFLNKNKINEISVIGAELGANVGINFVVDEPKIQRIVLLSPGIEYQGINTVESIKRYDRPLLILFSKDDEYSGESSGELLVLSGGDNSFAWESTNQLFNLSPSRARLEQYEGNNHGIEILRNLDESRKLLFEWLNEN